MFARSLSGHSLDPLLASLDAVRGFGCIRVVLISVVNAVAVAVDDVFLGVTKCVVLVEGVVNTALFNRDPVLLW